MYRIVQEALTNAHKHAAPNLVTVELVEDESRVELRIRDDGNGFEPTARAKGFGLAGMRERAELLGGTLTVHSTPGEGTIVAATVPAHRRTETAATVEQRDLRSADQPG